MVLARTEDSGRVLPGFMVIILTRIETWALFVASTSLELWRLGKMLIHE